MGGRSVRGGWVAIVSIFSFFFLYFRFTTVIECVQNYRSRGCEWAVVAADCTLFRGGGVLWRKYTVMGERVKGDGWREMGERDGETARNRR